MSIDFIETTVVECSRDRGCNRGAKCLVIAVVVVVVVTRAVVVADRALVAGVTLIDGGRCRAHDERCDEVNPDAHSCEEHEQYGDQADRRRFDAEVLSNAAAHAKELFVGSGFVKFFHGESPLWFGLNFSFIPLGRYHHNKET